MTAPDLRDIKGQETAKRALEVAAAGGHNLLMVGPPGAGKSMLAARLPGLLPLLSPSETLEVSMIASVAGLLTNGRLTRRRPFRDPHHNASQPAMVGGGTRARPGEEIVTSGGIIGKVVHVDENRLTVKTGENTRITVDRAKVATVLDVKGKPKEEKKQ